MPLPSERPTSGSLRGPNTMSAITKITMSSGMPSEPNMIGSQVPRHLHHTRCGMPSSESLVDERPQQARDNNGDRCASIRWEQKGNEDASQRASHRHTKATRSASPNTESAVMVAQEVTAIRACRHNRAPL